MNSSPFHKNSYEKHSNWYNSQFPTVREKIDVLNSFKTYEGSINHWLQEIFFNCLNPFLDDKEMKWMTIGDAYGHDANYLLSKNIKNVIATDLNSDFLTLSQEIGFIKEYSIENAESLSLKDNSMDYILCKESYHHFPRPYAALYEMIRVAKRGMIIIEPQDPISKMPLLLFLFNILERINPRIINKIWKNRFSHEPVGNFVYKVSEREFEKFAAGLNLSLIAIKKLNPNFWFPGSNKEPALNSNKKFTSILFKKRIRDTLSKLGIIPSQSLSIAIFKSEPSSDLRNSLKADGYKLIEIPKNPYLT